ncbi:MAG: hypothetical protein NWE80_00710 [Candidatus Bathyarchaeota archaeon]|nr:hypothetical protein [Candidatus Bathyarchaeota archaeon]
MSSIGKKIRLAFSRKKPVTVEIIRFSEVKSYIEAVRNSEKVSKDYSFLIKNYEEFIEKLDEVKRELLILRENGEKRFTKMASENLDAIENLNEFNSSSFREFIDNTAQVILSVMKIPAGIQRKTLKYENGKETINALNSFLKSFRTLKNVSSELLAENSVVRYHGDALKKYKEMRESFRKKEILRKKIELLRKEKEGKKRNLEESTENLRAIRSKIDNKEILEAKKHVTSLNNKIREITSDMKINLRKGRRPISKVLHSKDRKLFEFFQYFIEFPLENINARFWEIIATLEKESINLGEKERKKIDNFINFSKRRLNDRIREYEDAKTKKKKLEENLSKISFRNKEILGDFELKKETAQNDFTWKSKKLEETINEKNMLETDVKKNAKILENMLCKILSNKVKIEFD